MKIIVQSAGAETVKLCLPSGLALNPVSALVLPKLLRRNGINADSRQMLLLMRAVNRYRRSHPGWKLVEVESADGEHVEISI